MMKQATVSLADLPRLKRLQAKAIKEDKISFEYRGHILLVSYCKYLIEYLELKKKERSR